MPRPPAIAATPGIHAILGPTNTGKTHLAIERMLRHRNGVIGLPLRLLAREVYDRIAARRGAAAVALITGEEKIVPDHAHYMVCTAEAMPTEQRFDYLAVDEIQLCADAERGHVFTDRLLRARGTVETVFLGSDRMRPRIAQLVPEAQLAGSNRLSRLSHAPRARLDRLPPRTAVVAFSSEEVYAIAERIRQNRGGAAVVLGALSPRTRNAQVELFQSGEVETIVATDAIGMGLNLDIDHVAFAALSKFDGLSHRDLFDDELGQIAGRAGRHRKPGSFGVAGNVPALPPATARAIEEQRFPPVRRLAWRNPILDFSSLPALVHSLNQEPDLPNLARMREGFDARALTLLADTPGIASKTGSPAALRLLWDACRIPDYSKLSPSHHAGIVGEVFEFLVSVSGRVSEDWMHRNLERVDNGSGDIATLSGRLAHARTWQYIANQPAWLDDPAHWRGRTRAIEDRLSDALHQRLVARFVDRRMIALAKGKAGNARPAISLAQDDSVLVEGELVGTLACCQFYPFQERSASMSERERTALNAAVRPILASRATKIANSVDGTFDLGPDATVLWNGAPLARLTNGTEILRPEFTALVDKAAAPEDLTRIQMRVQAWLTGRVESLFAPLIALRENQELTGTGRGIAFRISEKLGILPRREVSKEIGSLSQAERRPLRALGVRFGYRYLFVPALLRPEATRWRLMLWGLAQDRRDIAPPPPGLANLPTDLTAPEDYYPVSGFHRCGARAVRIDLLERLDDFIRKADTGEGFESNQDMLSVSGCSPNELCEVLEGLGYVAERRERKTPPNTAPVADTEPAEASPDPVPAENLAEVPPKEKDSVTEPSTEPGPSVVHFFRRPPRPRRSGRKTAKPRSHASGQVKPSRNRKARPDKNRSSRPAPRRKPPDPNSPFAVLATIDWSKKTD